MSTTTSRQAAIKAEQVERRWQRVQAISARSCAQRRSPASDRVATEDRRFEFFRRPRGILAATLLPATLTVLAGFFLWRGPDPKDVEAGQVLFAHKWQPHDPLSAAG